MDSVRKISDQEFLAILRANSGLYARTAKAIEKQFEVTYTRQAVRQRAESFPEELADIREENIDVAEDGLYTLMHSDDDRVKLKAIELYLKTIGKHRGYVERSELTGAGGKDLVPPAAVQHLSTDQIKEILNGKGQP